MEFKFTNVNEAFYGMINFVETNKHYLSETESRNGPVLYFQEPVTICYEKPWQRVLFNRKRDANPFFHLYESLWMLAGRNDLAPILNYVSTFGDYSDDGVTLNGAYGYRWKNSKKTGIGINRHGFNQAVTIKTDQLDELIKHIQQQPNTRRAVLQMWNVQDDLLKVNNSKDVCCNLSACFLLREKDEQFTIPSMRDPNWPTNESNSYLDMTVFNRSNDLVWGTLGANVVHFSFLQEYIAQSLGVAIGKYYQVSNNLHLYLNNWEPDLWLEDIEYMEEYPQQTQSLTYNDDNFDDYCEEVVDVFSEWDTSKGITSIIIPDNFLEGTAYPMLEAFWLHKERNYHQALTSISLVQSEDWKLAGKNWLLKREANWKKKQTKSVKST